MDFNESNNTHVNDLMEILKKFEETDDLRKTVNTNVGLNNVLKEFREINKEFKQAVREILTPGQRVEVSLEVALALKNNNETFENLKNAAWITSKDATLSIFDAHVEKALYVLNKLDENRYDTSEARNTLSEIEMLREEFGEAYNNHDRILINEIRREINNLAQELKQQVKDLQVKVPVAARTNFWLYVADKASKRADMIISDLNKLDIETKNLVEINNEAKELINLAAEEIVDNNFGNAIEYLKQVRELNKEIREEYRNIINLNSEEIPEALEEVIDNTIEDLEDSNEEMNELEEQVMLEQTI